MSSDKRDNASFSKILSFEEVQEMSFLRDYRNFDKPAIRRKMRIALFSLYYVLKQLGIRTAWDATLSVDSFVLKWCHQHHNSMDFDYFLKREIEKTTEHDSE